MPERNNVLDGGRLRRLIRTPIRASDIPRSLADVALDPSRIDVDRGRETAQAVSAAIADAVRDALNRLPSERRRRQQRIRTIVQAAALVSVVAGMVGMIAVWARRVWLPTRGLDVERRLEGEPEGTMELRAVGPGPSVPVEPSAEPIAGATEPSSTRSEGLHSDESTEPVDTTVASGVSTNGVLNAREP